MVLLRPTGPNACVGIVLSRPFQLCRSLNFLGIIANLTGLVPVRLALLLFPATYLDLTGLVLVRLDL